MTLSQKFPPAIAFEHLEFKPTEPRDRAAADPSFEVIHLRAGYPTIDSIQLDELSILSSSISQKEPLRQSLKPVIAKTIKPSLEGFQSELNENLFTEEEKTRLRVAQLRLGLDASDISLFQEKNLHEKVTELLGRDETQLPEKSPYQGALLQGDIEFVRDGTLALTDQHIIDVRRFEEGRPKEVAQVDLSRGQFSLRVQNPNGVIVGRLMNQRGGIEGEGQIRVADLLAKKDQRLILRRAAARDPVRASSAYGRKYDHDQRQRIVLAGASAENQGGGEPSYDINALDPKSHFIAEASVENHRATLSMVNSQNGADMTLLPERMIRGLTDILMDQDIVLDLDRGDSLIWGSVQLRGRPVEGAMISIESSSVNHSSTAYFGGLYLPDPTRSKTSDNGLFAIVVHTPTWMELRIDLPDGQRFEANALCEPGKVTQIVVELPSELIPVTIRSFDALSGEPIAAKIEIQNHPEPIQTEADGSRVVSLRKSPDLFFALAQPQYGPYLPIRLAFSSLVDYLHFPFITEGWLTTLSTNPSHGQQNQTGRIVGFVQGADFTIEIPNWNESYPLSYFDATGALADQGRAGGGFVLFDLPKEVSNLVIRSKGSGAEMAHIVRPDPQYIQVINVQLKE